MDDSVRTTSPPHDFYTSVPLLRPSHSIRLLDIAAAAGPKKDDPLAGTIRVVSLDSLPPYSTLSYVWGSRAEPCDTVLLQPQRYDLKVTRNCYSALWHLRNSFGALTIWVDCICINQDDEQEKALQIPLMNRIYADAAQLYIWLGPGNDATNLAIDYLTMCATLQARVPFHLITTRDWSRKSLLSFRLLISTWMARFRTLAEAATRLLFWASVWEMAPRVDLGELLDREWIRRAWTYQEIILSPNPTIVCGNKTLSWEDFATYLLLHDTYGPGQPKAAQEHEKSMLVQTIEETIGDMPRTPSSFASWRATVTLWLHFGRYSDRLEALNESTGGVPFMNNYEKLSSICEYNRLAGLPHFIAETVPWSVVYLVWFVGWVVAMICFLALLFPDAIQENLGEITTSLCLAGLYIMVMLGILFQNGILYIVFGSRPCWSSGAYYRRPSADGMYFEGVRVALRDRISSRPHDMVYSMMAILETMGLTNVKVDYQQAASDLFKDTFVSIVELYPPALAALCDAGISPGDPTWTGPSWVPNWAGPHPNPAVSSLYSVDAPLPTHSGLERTTLTTGQYRVSGTSLHIKSARAVGRITFATPSSSEFSSSPANYPAADMFDWYRRARTSLETGHMWYPAVRLDSERHLVPRFLQSAVFASLEATMRPRTAFVYRAVKERDVMRRRRPIRYAVVINRPDFQAPMNFSDTEGEFKSCAEWTWILDELLRDRPEMDFDPTAWWAAIAAEGGRENDNGHRMASAYAERIRKMFSGYRNRVLIVVSRERDSPEGGVWCEWIGTAPWATKVGDWVFRLPGVPACMVLRETERKDEYRVVGSTLIPFLPDGSPPPVDPTMTGTVRPESPTSEDLIFPPRDISLI